MDWKGREGNGREGKEMEGKGREWKGVEWKGREAKGREAQCREGQGMQCKAREGSLWCPLSPLSSRAKCVLDSGPTGWAAPYGR
jgi:hypothetical protein